MSDNNWICLNQPFAHDWRGGLNCRSCEATRTAAEAIASLLAGQQGWDHKRAEALVELHQAEILQQAAGHLDQIADAVEAQVAAHFGPASGIGPGTADMVRNCATAIRSLTSTPQHTGPHPSR